MILNSQPQVSYALMDLMVKINAVNMEVFQVLCSSTFVAWPGFIRPSTENALILWFIPNIYTRSVSPSPSSSPSPSPSPGPGTSYSHRPYARSQTAATATATIPRIPSSASRSALASEPSNPGIPSASSTTSCGATSSSAGCHGITAASPELARRSKSATFSFDCVAQSEVDAYSPGYVSQGPLDDPRTNQYAGSDGAGWYHAIGAHLTAETSVAHLTRQLSEGHSWVNSIESSHTLLTKAIRSRERKISSTTN